MTELKEVGLHRNYLLKNLSSLLCLVQMPLASAAQECTVCEGALLGKNAMAYSNVVGYVSKPLINDIEQGQWISLSISKHLVIDGDGVTELVNNHQGTEVLVERLTPELSRAAKRRRLE